MINDSLNNIYDTVDSDNSSYDSQNNSENSSYDPTELRENWPKRKTWKAAGKAVKKTTKSVKKVATDAGKIVTDNFADPTKAIKDLANKALKQVKDAGNNATRGVEDAANKATKGVTDAADSAIDGVENVANKAKDSLESFVDTAKDAIMDTVDKAFAGIKVIIDELLKIGKKFIGFFDIFEKLWKKFLDAGVFFNKRENVIAFIFTSAIPFVGQLIARFMILDGSMDKPWLLFFAVPPLTLVPAFFMMFGAIKPLRGGDPVDKLVWLPIMGTVLGTIIAQGSKPRHVFKLLLSLGGFSVAYLIKTKRICGDRYDNDKIVLDSITSYMFTVIFALILPYVPFIGKFVGILQAVVPMSDLMLQVLAVIIVYATTNIMNGTFNKQHCRASIKEEDLYKVIFSAVCLTAVTAFSPGDVTSMVIGMAQSQGMKIPGGMPM